MEETIIKELLNKYGVSAEKEFVEACVQFIQLGFNSKWLRNVCIIREFDELYKTDLGVMDIYMDLGIKYQDLSIVAIRKIISNRSLYEV
jgi:hypothetical protein